MNRHHHHCYYCLIRPNLIEWKRSKATKQQGHPLVQPLSVFMHKSLSLPQQLQLYVYIRPLEGIPWPTDILGGQLFVSFYVFLIA